MTARLRDSGIEIVGKVPWGTHLCLFYKTKNDMLDLLVPYFRAGLENNEFCVWVTSEPITVEDAEEALKLTIPDYDRFKENDRIEIVPYTEWYLKDGYFDLERVFDDWIGKLEGALERGLGGLRATGNTAWLETEDWKGFTEYEEELDRRIGSYQMMAVCTYSLDKCGASEIIDVIKNHEYALINREGEWQLIESQQRKKARETLRQSEARYQSIVENIHDAVIMTNPDYNITAWNHAAEEIYGWKAEEVLGHHIFEQLGIEMDDATRERAFEPVGNSSFFWGTMYQRKKDGKLMPVECFAFPMRNADEGIYAYLAVCRDVTARKRAEEGLRALSEELLLANTELDSYARSVSHDLRGPLAAAILANDMLNESACDSSINIDRLREEAAETTSTTQRNLARCFNLIDDLLALAEAGQKPVAASPVDVASIVRDILAEQHNVMKEKGFQVLLDNDLGVLNANKTQIYQIFYNLIVNALRHNDNKKPVIEVRYLGDENGVAHRYVVRDNGTGIPPEHAEDIFRPFFKYGDSSDTGLGLSIVRKTVEAYNGEIKTRNDDGACFEFTIKDV